MTPGSKHDELEVHKESSTCAICLSTYCGRVYLSPCFHSFCAPCLASWLDVTLLCPLCKTRPSKLHWGADTTLGTLNTIAIPGAASPYVSQRIVSHSALDTILDVSDSSTSSPSLLLSTPLKGPSSWRAALKRVAAVAEHDLKTHSKDLQDTHLDTIDKRQDSIDAGDPLDKSSRKRDPSPESDQDVKRFRHSSRSSSRSRSRSMTPIDSYPHVYDSSDLYLNGQTSSPHSDLPLLENNPSESENSPAELPASPSTLTRRQVYALGMKPHPAQEYLLADRIVATDMIRLAPFLGRDLAVLTDVDPEPVDPIVLAYVTSLFNSHGGDHVGTPLGRRVATDREHPQARWDLIESGVAEWVTMTLGDERTAISLAKQFVEEMRRVTKKRWGPGQWDSNVRYGA